MKTLKIGEHSFTLQKKASVKNKVVVTATISDDYDEIKTKFTFKINELDKAVNLKTALDQITTTEINQAFKIIRENFDVTNEELKALLTPKIMSLINLLDLEDSIEDFNYAFNLLSDWEEVDDALEGLEISTELHLYKDNDYYILD